MKAKSTSTDRASGEKPVVPDAAALQAAASLFRSLGDPSRLAILSHLLLGEHRVVELTEHLGLAQSTVSAHLRCLLDCGLVRSRPVGRASVFAVTHEPDVLAVLAAAEGLLASTGDAVVLCPCTGHVRSRPRHGHERRVRVRD